MKKTKIVCTIGPKTESVEKLTELVNAGMNVMRLNFSHGDYAEHGTRIANFRQVMEAKGKQLAILLDTKGPEIRTIKLEGGNDVRVADVVVALQEADAAVQQVRHAIVFIACKHTGQHAARIGTHGALSVFLLNPVGRGQ